MSVCAHVQTCNQISITLWIDLNGDKLWDLEEVDAVLQREVSSGTTFLCSM